MYIKVILNSSNHPVCACEACNKYIAAPSNGVKYSYCYNCGAKFDKTVSAQRINRAKIQYKLRKAKVLK